MRFSRIFPPTLLADFMTPFPPRLLLGLAIVLSPLHAFSLDRDDDDPPAARSSGPPRQGQAPRAEPVVTLTLSAQGQRIAGLRTLRPRAEAYAPEWKAFGTVADLQPLFDLRARFRAVRSELAIAEAASRVAGKNRERLALLHREAIVPTRELIQAEAQQAQELARVEAARNRLREVREAALQQWGVTLFEKVIETESALFRALLERRQVLILVTVGGAYDSVEVPAAARLSLPGQVGERSAHLLSSAPRGDSTLQGTTWFYLADAGGLRTGSRLEVWLPRATAATVGVAIPLSAVLWHEGKPWVYVKRGEDRFSRVPVVRYHDRGDNWLVGESLNADEEIVVDGGQTLLSEELRRLIPDEDDD
jgi:hypothetical protein